MIERNKNYASEMKFVVVEGQEYPLLKTSEKMVFYVKDDVVKRIKFEKVSEIR